MNIGIYYVVSNEADHEKRLVDLPKIKSLGINTICTYLLPTDKPFIDACRNSNIKILIERGKTDSSLTKLDKVVALAGDTAYGILTFDDVDSPKNLYVPADVLKLNNLANTKYNLPLYMSGGYINRIDDYKHLGAKIIMQGYPIGNNDETVSDVAKYWKAGWSGGWSPAVQAFRWPGKRLPTEIEIRSMGYQAICLSARELWYYCFYDASNDMSINSALRTQIKRIISELRLGEQVW